MTIYVGLNQTLTQIKTDAENARDAAIASANNFTNLRKVSSNTTLTVNDSVVLANGNTTITLPTAVNNTSRYFIKNTGNGYITVVGTSSQTIDNQLNMIMTETNSVIGLASDNTNWVII